MPKVLKEKRRTKKIRLVDYIFYADITKGYLLKIMIEVMSDPLDRVIFNLSKKGIFINQQDEESTVLFDVSLPRSKFRKYVCTKEKIISVNLLHIKNLLKNTKRKDSIILSIHPDEREKLSIEIRPEVQKTGVISRRQTSRMTYKTEIDHEDIIIPDDVYEFPTVINSTEFQKIKQQIGMGAKHISCTIQGNNYLCFSSDEGEIYDVNLEYGEWVECDENNNPLDPEICDGEDEDDEESGNKYRVYEAQFNSRMISKLIKLPSLGTNMNFCPPVNPQLPLKISMDVALQGYVLGEIKVFIKDEEQIALEKSLQEERPAPQKRKKRR